MNGIHRTSAQILEAFGEWGNDARFCTECKEFHGSADPSHYEHSRYSDKDLQVALEEAFIGEQEAFGQFITRIAFALGVPECFGGGWEEQAILDAIEQLKRRVA